MLVSLKIHSRKLFVLWHLRIRDQTQRAHFHSCERKLKEMKFWKIYFLSTCFSKNTAASPDPGNPCSRGITGKEKAFTIATNAVTVFEVKNLPEWEGDYLRDGESENGHPIYVANGDERFLYVIETFGVKKWHFSYMPDGKGAYAWANFQKNCPSEVRYFPARSYKTDRSKKKQTGGFSTLTNGKITELSSQNWNKFLDSHNKTLIWSSSKPTR